MPVIKAKIRVRFVAELAFDLPSHMDITDTDFNELLKLAGIWCRKQKTKQIQLSQHQIPSKWGIVTISGTPAQPRMKCGGYKKS